MAMNRRTVLKLGATAAAAIILPKSLVRAATQDDRSFIDVRRLPDSVTIVTERGSASPTKGPDGRWEADGSVVETAAKPDALLVSLSSANSAVKQIRLTWNGQTSAWQSVLGDHWERTYGDVGWGTPNPERTYPWYLLAQAGGATHAMGVRTQPAAFCGWRVSADGVSLVCDVRSGGVGVELGDRTLRVCEVIARQGDADESAFAATRAFCAMMCPKPRLADHVIYGANDWYYAYGQNSPEGLIADSALLSELAGDNPNRPYSVIDDGWQTKSAADLGQWSATRAPFGSMPELAAAMASKGVRPGIWMRPLIDEIKAWPEEWHMTRSPKFLDPTRPEVKQIVAADIKRLREWGYQLIKHDFTSMDLLGRAGKDMKEGVTRDGWNFASRNQTTAEIIADLYRTIAEAAGDGIVLGCNTISHLSAGLFQINRTGDDTSGHEWKRNVVMGVNTLAFRGPHQDTFYGADADCCPVTEQLDWAKARQWLDLVARSGTPLFVSVDRKALTEQIRKDLAEAIRIASTKPALAEPLDWTTSPTPSKWKFADGERTYDWA